MSNTWQPKIGDHVRVATYADCDGDGEKHVAGEDGSIGEVTNIRKGEHGVFVLFRHRGEDVRVLGRLYAPGEVELLE